MRGRVTFDNWGDRPESLKQGAYAFVSKSDADRQIRIFPCGGADGVLSQIKSFLQIRATKPFDKLLVSLDADRYEGDRRQAWQSVRSRLAEHATRDIDDSAWSLTDESEAFALVAWHSGNPAVGVPAQQCLERIVCAALAAAYASRAAHVARWLAERPEPPSQWVAKSHAWSYMAGWCAEQGCEHFLKSLWSDEQLVPQLIRALNETNALRALSAVCGMDAELALRRRA